MAERVIFEYKADRQGSQVRFGREAARLLHPGPFLRRMWGHPWNRPFASPLRRREHRRRIQRVLASLQQIYTELYGSTDSDPQRRE
jgi:hypothetical protein